MTRLGRALLPGLALLGCSRGEAHTPAAETIPAPATAHPDEPQATPPFEWRWPYEINDALGSYAVIRMGTTLRAAPDPDSSSWAYDHWSDRVVRVVEQGPEFTTIELAWDLHRDALHCAESPATGLGLRVFVRASELADLTRVAQALELGPEAGINLAPGVPVHGREQLSVSLGPRAAGVEVFVDRSALDIDKFYTPARADLVPRPMATQLRGRVRYDDHELWFAPSLLDVFAQSADTPARVVVGDACVQIAGHYTPDPEADTRGVGGMGCSSTGRSLSAESWVLPVDTPLSWPNGEPAGRVVRTVRLPQRPARNGGRRCFAPRLGCSAVDALRVCVHASAPIHEHGDPERAQQILDVLDHD